LAYVDKKNFVIDENRHHNTLSKNITRQEDNLTFV
jgi:hypothetical protein